MAKETLRVITIHKQEKYTNSFAQVGVTAFGQANGSLKLVGLRMYNYLICNKNNFNFSLSPLAYARWLGKGYVNENNEIDDNKRAGVNKAIRDGIKDLIANGYLVEKGPYFYDFYENGEQTVLEETNCSEKNKQFSKEQTVSDETNCSQDGFIF